MRDDLEGFDQAYGRGGDAPPPVFRRKSLSQRAAFLLANVLLVPLLAVCTVAISAEGLRNQLPVTETRLCRLPIPGLAPALARYAGWDRIDIAILLSLVLFSTVAIAWGRVFGLLMDAPRVRGIGRQGRLLTTAASAVFVLLIGGDLVIFFAGLQARAASGWTDTPWFVAPLASLLYMACVAGLGLWHADHRRTGAV